MTPEELAELARKAAGREEGDTSLDLNALAQKAAARSRTSSSTPESEDTTMWDDPDLSYEDAMRMYEELEKDPNVSATYVPDLNGLSMIPRKTLVRTDPETGKKQIIPRPSPQRGSVSGVMRGVRDVVTGRRGLGEVLSGAYESVVNPRATVSAGDTLAYGMIEAGGDIARTGAAASDYVAGTDLYEQTDQAFPTVDTSGNIVDSLIADGIPLLVAGGGTAGAVAKGTSALAQAGTLGRAMRGLSVVLSGEIVASSATNTDEGTLLLGEDSLTGWFTGVDLGDEQSEKVLAHRANALVEGVMLGQLASYGYQAGKAGFDLGAFMVSGLTDLMSDDKVARTVYKDISSKLAAIDPGMSPEAYAAAIDDIANTVSENKEVVVRILENGTKEKKAKLNTIQALIRGTDDPNEIARLEGIQAGFMQRPDLNEFQTSQGNVARALDESITDLAKETGGETFDDQARAISQGGDAVAQSGRTQAALADAAVEGERATYDRMADQFWASVKDDLEFGAKLDDLAKRVGTQQADPLVRNQNAIMSTLEQTYTAMKAQKDELYRAISGGNVDGDRIVEVFDNLNDNEILTQIGRLQREPQVRKFIDEIQPRAIGEDDAGNAIMETSEQVAARVEDWLSRNDEGLGQFGFIQQRVRPALSKIADQMYRQGDGLAGDEIRSVIKFIDEDLVDDVARVNPELADAAREAKRYYKEEFADFFRGDGKLAEYARIYDNSLGRGIDQRGYDEGYRTLTDSVLGGKNAAMVTNLRDALNRPEGLGANGDAVADYYIYEMLSGFGDQIQIKGGLEEVDLQQLNTMVGDYKRVLREAFPEKAASLDRFLSGVNQSQKGLADQQKIIERTLEAAQKRKDEIVGGILSPFFRDQGMATVDNTYRAFEKVFSGDNPVDNLQKLRSYIGTLPKGEQDVAESGLKTAFARYYRSKVFTFSRESSGVNALSQSNIGKAEQQLTPLFSLTKEVFKDNPEVHEGLTQLAVIANQLQASRGAKPNASWSPTKYAQEAAKSTNRMIYTWIGPLSRLGTRLRALSSAVVERKATEEEAVKITNKILSDPEYFSELTKKYNKAPMDPKVKAEVARWFGSINVKVMGDDTSDNTPEEDQSETARLLREARGTVGSMARRAVDTVSDEARQMEEAFGEMTR